MVNDTDRELYKDAFPQAVIRHAINKGLLLSIDEADEVLDDKQDDSQTTATKIGDNKDHDKNDELSLPDGFLFHYFASHRQ